MLAGAAAHGAAPGDLLRALVRLDAVAAADALLGANGGARELIDDRQLARVFEELVSVTVDRSEAALTERLVRLAGQYSGQLSPDVLASLISVAAPAQRAGLRGIVAAALARDPRHGPLLGAAAEAAVAAGDPTTAHALLTRLGRADESLASMQRVWRMRSRLPETTCPIVRIGILGSFTVDPIVPYLDLECRALGLRPQVYVAPFDSWDREVLDTESGLRRFNAEIVILALSVDDLIPDLAGAMGAAELEDAGMQALSRVVAAIRAFRDWSGAPLIVHGFHSAHRDPAAPLQGGTGPFRSVWLAELTAGLLQRAEEFSQVYVLDQQQLLLRRSAGPMDEPKLRHWASMRLPERVLPEVARSYAQYIAPIKGLSSKCIVLDLDNTLWGGVVGEDGVHGIRLGTTAPGSEYREFQQFLLGLSSRGILLAINSKNNAHEALDVIRSHEYMLLRESAFSAMRINWLPKPENMCALARELDIGLDSMVFIDDNPNERELMRRVLPDVLTPELPPDPARYRQTIEILPQLQTLVVTEADVARSDQYRTRRQRNREQNEAASLDEHLGSLAVTVQVTPVGDRILARVHQLLQRTNQFNLTTRRYDATQLAELMRNPCARLYAAAARDRFGDHGLVATAIVRVAGECWVIDSFVMSCRAIGYGVESALLSAITTDAGEQGALDVVGELIETPRNVPARDFYARHGFAPNGTVNGSAAWHHSLARGAVPPPAWITLERRHEA